MTTNKQETTMNAKMFAWRGVLVTGDVDQAGVPIVDLVTGYCMAASEMVARDGILARCGRNVRVDSINELATPWAQKQLAAAARRGTGTKAVPLFA
jgi:hypothetical protein